MKTDPLNIRRLHTCTPEAGFTVFIEQVHMAQTIET
jgi:hypothetical protein